MAGVIASVAALVTGAANEGGFKGLAGRYARRELLRFGVPMRGEIRFTRLDSGGGRGVAPAAGGAAARRLERIAA